MCGCSMGYRGCFLLLMNVAMLPLSIHSTRPVSTLFSQDHRNCLLISMNFHKLNGINVGQHASCLYQFKMDSQSSTICSFQQLTMSALQKWAEKLVDEGRKRELLNLIDAIPTIQQLQELEIHALGNAELELLREIATRTMKSFDERELRIFQANVIKVSSSFQASLFLNKATLSKQIQEFQNYSNEVGAHLYCYLQENCTSEYPCDALEFYLNNQNRVVQNFLLLTCQYLPESSISKYCKKNQVGEGRSDRQSHQKGKNVSNKQKLKSSPRKKTEKAESPPLTGRQGSKLKKPSKGQKYSPEKKGTIK